MLIKENPKLYNVYYKTTDKLKKLTTKYSWLLIVIVAIVFAILINSFYNNYKITSYNQKILDLVNKEIDMLNQNSAEEFDYVKLKELYSDTNLPQTTKSFAGLNLAKYYKKNNKFTEARGIYEEIYKNEKDLFIKDLSGLNLLSLYISDEYSENKISTLFNELNKAQNPLINLTIEQYSLYLLEKNNKEEAKEMFKLILKDENLSGTLLGRIMEYNKIYKLELKF